MPRKKWKPEQLVEWLANRARARQGEHHIFRGEIPTSPEDKQEVADLIRSLHKQWRADRRDVGL